MKHVTDGNGDSRIAEPMRTSPLPETARYRRSRYDETVCRADERQERDYLVARQLRERMPKRDDGQGGRQRRYREEEESVSSALARNSSSASNTQNDEIRGNRAIHATHVIRVRHRGYRYLIGEAGAHVFLTALYR